MVNEDSSLRKKAREAMDTGRLPDRAPDHIWGGPGTGVECAMCGRTIARSETELEIEFARNNGTDAQVHLVHLRCFSLLEIERQSRTAPGGSSRSRDRAARADDPG